MMTETAFKSLCINMFIFTSTRILGMVSLLFLLISGGFFIVGYLAISISRSIENIIRELAEDENYIDFKKNMQNEIVDKKIAILFKNYQDNLYARNAQEEVEVMRRKAVKLGAGCSTALFVANEVARLSLRSRK